MRGLTLFPYRGRAAQQGRRDLELLSCNSAKGTGSQAELIARLQRDGIRTA